MTSTLSSFRTLSDRDLLEQLERAVGQERQATAHLIALLMEVDARKLYATQSCSSLFTYCVQVLHLSEYAAYLRIEAARAARRFPVILERLADGSLHLTAVSLLAPHLTVANHAEVLDAARHKSKRDVEQLVARYRPQPDVAAVVRKLPVPKPAVIYQAPLEVKKREADRSAAAPPTVPAPRTRPPEVKPLAPQAATSPRPPPALDSQRRSFGDLRSSADAVAGGTFENKMLRGRSPAAWSEDEGRLASHSCAGKARGVAPRRRPVRVSRRAGPLPRNGVSRVPSRGAVREAGRHDYGKS